MLKTIFERMNPNLRGKQLMAELQRLVSLSSNDRTSLDARALADVEAAVLNSGRPGLIALYRRLLTDVDIDAEQPKTSVSPMRFTWPSQVLESATTLVAKLLILADRITAARRNGRDRCRYQESQ